MSQPVDSRQTAVVIPTYNHAHFLASAIESVLAQTLPVTEVIVVDDGSADRPEEVTRRFPQAHLLRQENRGLAAARNAGLRSATARYLIFLDADDRLRPEAAMRGLELLESDPGAGMAYGGYCNVGHHGDAGPAVFSPVPRDAFGAFLRGNQVGMHAAVMYRRAPLEAVGGFREGLPACEDYDVYLRLSRRYPVLCRPEVLAEYWRHGENMSRNSALMLRSALDVLAAHRDAAMQAGLMQDYRAGVAGWKQHYASAWVAGARGMWRGKMDRRALRQGLGVLRLAPTQLVRGALAAVAGKALGRQSP